MTEIVSCDSRARRRDLHVRREFSCGRVSRWTTSPDKALGIHSYRTSRPPVYESMDPRVTIGQQRVQYSCPCYTSSADVRTSLFNLYWSRDLSMQVLPEDITVSAIIPRNSLIFHYSRRSFVLLFGYVEVLVRRLMEGQGGSSEGF